ncbi:MAG: tetratricopeptide repeat protein [Spirochaetota bacterium]|nr:tetratricopeptide repeat protein [Spirochaetota bacterium]
MFSFKNIRLLLFESFLPFLVMLIVLFILMIRIDSKIEKSSNTIIIDLLPDKEPQEKVSNITQSIPLEALSSEETKIAGSINMLIVQKKYSEAILGIQKLKNSLQKKDETAITLAFCYYKVKNYELGIKTLSSIHNKKLPRRHFNLGLIYSKLKGSRLKAIKHFKLYLKSNPGSWEASSNIALLYYKTKNYMASADYLQKTLKLTSGSKRKARTYYRLGRTLKAQSQDKQAIKAFEKAVRLDPNDVKARIHLAELIMKKDFDKGMKMLTKLTTLSRDYPTVYYHIAKKYYSRKDMPNAIKQLSLGLEKSRHSLKLRSYLAFVYLNSEEYANASKILSQLAVEYPNRELYSFRLGRAHYGMKQYQEAINHYNYALKLRPNYYKALVNLGVTHAAVKNYKMAIHYYRKALDLNAKSEKTYYNLGLLYYKTNRYEESTSAYQKAIQLKAKYPTAYNGLGQVYLAQKNIHSARKSFRKSIELDKNYSSSYVLLSQTYILENKERKARDTLENALKQVRNPELMNTLAGYHMKDMKLRNAEKLYKASLKMNKDELDAMLGLGRLYLKEKRYALALSYMKRYIFVRPKDPEARYIYMKAFYHSGKKLEAFRQLRALEGLSGKYPDLAKYKKLLKSFDK